MLILFTINLAKFELAKLHSFVAKFELAKLHSFVDGGSTHKRW